MRKKTLFLIGAAFALHGGASAEVVFGERGGVLSPMTLPSRAEAAVEVLDQEISEGICGLPGNLPAPSARALVEQGQALIEMGDAEQALCFLQAGIEQGETGKTYSWLARAYFMNENYEAGHQALSQALESDNENALLMLADFHENGKYGFEKSYLHAFSAYYKLAQNHDNTYAMHTIGYYFIQGLLGEKDEVASVHWYHEAAKRGYKDARIAYAWMAKNGVGMQKDEVQAEYFIN